MKKQEGTFKIDGRELKLTRLEKVFYPESGFTKGQVIDYYARVAPALLPHLRDRPLTLKRYPNGVEQEFFYEKRAPKYRPSWMKTAPVPSDTDPTGFINYCLVNDLSSLIWLANLADLELHPFLAKKQNVQCPTQIVFDLDPGAPADATDCAEVALWIRDIFEKIGLRCFIKSSGSKGLQIHLPLNTPTTYEITKRFARAFAVSMQEAHPDRVVYDMKKALRPGKVLIDWSQNDASKTTILVYSLRAKTKPFVAAPLTWDEVVQCFQKGDPTLVFFETEQVLKRLEKKGDLFAEVLTLKQKLPPNASEKVSELLKAAPAKSAPAPQSARIPASRTLKTTRATEAVPNKPAPSSDTLDSLARLFVEPMKCLPRETVPSATDWLYEIKFDGYRSLAICRKGAVLLLSRNRKTLNARFPDLVQEVAKLPVREAIFDGEIVALDEHERPSFQILQNYEQGPPLLYYFFDLLSLDGKDLTQEPLEVRRKKLETLLKGISPRLLFSSELRGTAEDVWKSIREQNLEGIVAKRRKSTYESGRRSGQWVKVKAINQQDFVVGGYTEPRGGRAHFGALLVGVHEDNGLRFCGKVGTGFDQQMLASLYGKMEKLKIEKCPFFNLPEPRTGRWGGGITASEMKRCTWIKPVLIGEVQFTEWTGDGSLRHPSFLGLRDDISPADVHRETPER